MSEQNPENKALPVRPSGGAAGEQAAGGDANAALSRRERLAAAAEQRRTQRSKERERAAAIGLDAGERVDDALTRATDKFWRFMRQNFSVMQWVLVAAIAGWVGYQIYLYRSAKAQAKVGDTLSEGAVAVLSSLKVEPAPGEQPEGATDSAPKFNDDAARIKAARDAFNAAIALHKTEGSVAFAELSLAGLQFDEGKFAEARASYERVKGEPATQKFSELKGRAMEGVALSYEAAGDNEGALKAYREIENSGIDGFVDVALLAQGRLLVEKNDLAGAKDALEKLNKRLEKAKIKTQETFYLGPTIAALQLVIDPTGASKPKTVGTDMEALQKTLQELAKKAGKPMPTPVVPHDPAPAPTPGTPVPKPVQGDPSE